MSTDSYKNEYIEKFNEIIIDECSKNKVDFIEFFEKFSKLDYKKLLVDGVHPNTKGHKLIFGIVKNFLVEGKVI
jgi:lysophospholipase L1-like esterase